MKYTIEDIVSIVQGSFQHFFQNDSIGYLLIDSRKLIFADGSLFFALRGPRRSGIAFIKDLYQKGVRNFVVEEEIPVSAYPQANIILVSDTLRALQQLAAYHRQQFLIPVIGITGSNGKTIVKEWLNQLLEDQYNIVRSPRSYNSQVGVPLSVWQMNPTSELGIFEAGISQPREMQYLEAVIRPTIGILTNIGEAHGEGFENIESKIEEKLKLFRQAFAVIYRSDDMKISHSISEWKDKRMAELKDKPVEIMDWGHDKNARVKIRAIDKTQGTTTITLSYGRETFPVTIPFTDEASVENAVHCVCVLLYLGTPADTIRNKFIRLSVIAMRLELKGGINHCSIINDSYSADLSSLKIALDFLAQQQQQPRRTVILSDILQSGREEQELYKEAASLLQQIKTSRLIAIGERITANRNMFERLKETETIFFPSTDNFIKNFHQLHFRNETILIKGARIFEFEKIDRLLARQVHRTVLEINLNAMAHNLKQYQQKLHPATKLMAMVKAFAYGGGSYEIASLLQFHKVDYLAVAYADEGVELRQSGIHMPIMVMNPEDSSLEALVQYNLEPVIYSFGLMQAVENFLKKEGIRQMPVHIEVETGMNRLGFPKKDIQELRAALIKSSFTLKSIFSHLAASDEAQHDAFTMEQARSFLQMADQIQELFPYPILKHLANTAAIIRHPQLQLDMVRLGIGLYGIDSTSSGQLELEEVSVLKSTIAQVRHLKQGETVGYNRKGIPDRDAMIATVRIGYADGYPRSLGNGAGKMWLKGHLVPTMGSICMDMTMIDITGVPGVQENDEIIVFGKEVSVQQVAHWAQTIPYEILTGVSQRVKRIYFEE
ncbi:MAG TPA: bifunctional UDP-N-acetylmuramoyl-tripeptide:D-alanyl-D-alanine ligase/alanine racemase [Puia sp.]|nr:bifunctional UDP-N-acetylmuramoyl-tripeptide:D-alanyl-D-alanine ligase/alanine racemase [Puia sp.]